ncbi:hypothetical protein HGRIS_006374 [Hohenbuehelia grisea]|uniref:O-methyltransferase domain-containing protein n=1 Tax=Hohenbuehelia grisea TaxID=104357 RepID=A0ABR3JZQ0_9AGAR
MASTILELSELICSSTSTLIQTCDDDGFKLPHLHDVSSSRVDTEAFQRNPVAKEAVNVILAAALQLVATLAPASTTVLNLATAHFKSAALRVCLENNVTEALREAGPQGMHVNELAKRCNLDSDKLSRILRLLANDHVYREITPEVFTNTRLSMVLDTGKDLEDIQSDIENKHEGTTGFVAYLEHMSSDAHKASAYLNETLTNPVSACSPEPVHSPFHRAFEIDLPVWKWYEHPEQAYRRRRFALGMQGLGAVQPPDTILREFDWKQCDDGAVVVDVGGGIGASILPVARAHPHLHVIIQDLPNVASFGTKFYEGALPGAVESGRVKFMPHDFFAPQPVDSPSVFILKHIVHNWSDQYAAKILSSLRKAAGPNTTLLVVDLIVAYTCHDPSVDQADSVPGSTIREAPKPLLANYGPVSESAYGLDLTMLAFLNAQERTFGKLRSLLESAGWRMKRAHRGDPPGDFLQLVEAVPC